MKATDLLIASAKYAYARYFLTHFMFSLPYAITVSYVDDPYSYSLIQALGYTSIVLWFLYGLVTTQQHLFVIACGILFLASQAAYYAGEYTWDLVLTLSCVSLALVKLYVSRYETYDYVRFLETGQYTIKLTTRTNGSCFQVYSKQFGKFGFQWRLTDLSTICDDRYPTFMTLPEAQKVVCQLLVGRLSPNH